MTVGSLFAGIGGFDLGLERAGFTIKWQVEIDSYCQRVLAKHWPGVKRYGDIRNIDWGTVPGVDVLCGGFPCQDISLAGKRAGIDGERSGLWSEYVRAIRALRPRYILVENVPGLLTNQYMGRVLGDLAEGGYDAEWQVLSAYAFGAPHLRRRVWIVAYPHSSRAVGIGQNGNSSDEEWDAEAQVQERENVLTGACGSNWWAREPGVERVANGLPMQAHRDRGLGNAIVPQIAEWLGRQIMNVEHTTPAVAP